MQLLRAIACGAGTASFPDLRRLIGLLGSLLGDRRDRMVSFQVSSLPIGASHLLNVDVESSPIEQLYYMPRIFLRLALLMDTRSKI